MLNFNRKLKVYLDTSVISYLDQKDAPEKQEITQRLWECFINHQYDVYISKEVIDEISACNDEKLDKLLSYMAKIDYNLLEVDDNVFCLAEKIVDLGVLKRKSIEDARHIASAIVSGCDAILSWNFKHIVNVKTIQGVKIITTAEGFKDLMIYSPETFIQQEE